MIPKVKLTVIIRNNAPFIHLQEPPTLRSVSIILSHEQLEQLNLELTDKSNGIEHYEVIRECFLDNIIDAEIKDTGMSLTINDYIDFINKLVEKYGVEIDLLAWNELKNILNNK